MSASSLPWLLPAVDPAPVEAAAEAAGQALYDAMLPLHAYRAQLRGRADLTPWQFEHLRHVEVLLDAIVADQQQTGQLLTVLRTNAIGLNAQLHLALDEPRPLPADRTSDPLYRIGWVRGYQQATRHQQGLRERLASLYALHATLTPPPGYEPSPLAARLARFLDSPAARAYGALPLATRQAVDALTPGELQAHLDYPGPAHPSTHPLPDPRRAA